MAVCGQPLEPNIDYRYEIMVVVEAVSLGFCFLLVEQYIKLNAATLLERDIFLKQLYNTNVDLRKQLRKERQLEIVDLESPMTKVLQILNEVKRNEAADAFMVKELDRLIKVLNSDQLYTPDIFQKSADADVSEWLKVMMQTAKVELAPPTTPAGASGTTLTKLRGGAGANSGVATVTFALSPEYPMSLQESTIFDLLSQIDDPNFDVATVEAASNGRALFYVGYYLFAKHDLLRKHKIPEQTFRSWLARIEHGYRGTNPYHNATHAADVAHSMNYYITRTRIWSHITPEEQLGSLIAAIIHDFMHPGVNNSFLINASDPLALRYNDLAVLENFHCATVFEIIDASHDLNILKTLTMDSQRQVRETVISAVLATDIATHFDWIGKFKNKLSGVGHEINFDVKLDRRLVLNMAIKCADVNNPTKPLASCKFWTERIMEEFFRQGDEEKKRGVPVSMFMNRGSTDIPKCQLVSLLF
ncbi:UNVERIFIED_CONTAM: High affinity cAMP-specific 3',5'-cyclic phosphodiesterase 7A [Siphonaria sp. JEL0065]|nr:High affinity cAMP-specific 3',5'-cyclic phosphodiesterase 7A [Siphonaria sp. JEL0065]